MMEVPLTRGLVAIVDDEDYPLIATSEWQAMRSRKTAYARRWFYDEAGRRHAIIMHRWLIGAPADVQVDHKNGNGLDNRRENLRLATGAENSINWSRQSEKKTSRFRGVSWNRKDQRWFACIRARRVGLHKTLHLGSFLDEAYAARAYDQAARAHHGEFAILNFPGVP